MVFVFWKINYEVDFVLVSDNKVVELIQISVDISAQKTFNREVKALFRAAEELSCSNLTLVILNENRTYTIHN
jgi:hypothetical protein